MDEVLLLKLEHNFGCDLKTVDVYKNTDAGRKAAFEYAKTMLSEKHCNGEAIITEDEWKEAEEQFFEELEKSNSTYKHWSKGYGLYFEFEAEVVDVKE